MRKTQAQVNVARRHADALGERGEKPVLLTGVCARRGGAAHRALLARGQHERYGRQRGQSQDGEDRLVGEGPGDDAAQGRARDDGHAGCRVVEAVHVQQAAGIVRKKARVGVQGRGPRAKEQAVCHGQHVELLVAHRGQQAQDAAGRKRGKRDGQRLARTHGVHHGAGAEVAHDERHVEAEDQGGDLKGARAQHVGCAAYDAHEVRGLKSQLQKEVCGNHSPLGGVEKIQFCSQESGFGDRMRPWRKGTRQSRPIRWRRSHTCTYARPPRLGANSPQSTPRPARREALLAARKKCPQTGRNCRVEVFSDAAGGFFFPDPCAKIPTN